MNGQNKLFSNSIKSIITVKQNFKNVINRTLKTSFGKF